MRTNTKIFIKQIIYKMYRSNFLFALNFRTLFWNRCYCKFQLCEDGRKEKSLRERKSGEKVWEKKTLVFYHLQNSFIIKIITRRDFRIFFFSETRVRISRRFREHIRRCHVIITGNVIQVCGTIGALGLIFASAARPHVTSWTL